MLGNPYIVGRLIDHLARNSRVLNFRVPIGEAAALLFLLFRRHDSCSGFIKQFLQARWHVSPRLKALMNLITGSAEGKSGETYSLLKEPTREQPHGLEAPRQGTSRLQSPRKPKTKSVIPNRAESPVRNLLSAATITDRVGAGDSPAQPAPQTRPSDGIPQPPSLLGFGSGTTGKGTTSVVPQTVREWNRVSIGHRVDGDAEVKIVHD
jgi:hypothetical protein